VPDRDAVLSPHDIDPQTCQPVVCPALHHTGQLPGDCVDLLLLEHLVKVAPQAADLAACKQTDSKLCVISRLSAFATWKTRAAASKTDIQSAGWRPYVAAHWQVWWDDGCLVDHASLLMGSRPATVH
jgi:hypothetical protein